MYFNFIGKKTIIFMLLQKQEVQETDLITVCKCKESISDCYKNNSIGL